MIPDSSNIELVTFDVYMALMDIGGSLSLHIEREFGLSDVEADRFVALWRSKQMERAASSNSMALGHVPFSECTSMALDYTVARFDLVCDEKQATRLNGLWGQLTPWPEADGVISALNDAGIATAILSNGDQAMLEATATQFQGRFDHVLSAESAGKYKPHRDVYALTERELGIDRSRVLHVAGSPNDVLGAIAAGMPCIWSNRHAEVLVDGRYPPARVLPDLSGVPGVVLGT